MLSRAVRSLSLKKSIISSSRFLSTTNIEHDGMDRYPSLTSIGGVLRLFDYFGTLVFSAGGCVTGANAGLDLLGLEFINHL